ncbi:DUF559 domain-containing protein [Geothrix sp. PMB-07]|uniref:DUF559 domain-containing protein n=1 Tax=Geothrix sp. PMB-07 TaxID=3068640 RepID=UPI0027412F4F|nr:DUF559 domain-containing protein [Geothrix sp. PMB-07]WLT30887.1 DUF559 domain-containing protein [Geothrix sp. PMB-07]
MEVLKKDLFDQGAQFFSRFWLPRIFEEFATGDSPPEELLAFVIRILLWKEVFHGNLQILQQQPIEVERVCGSVKYKPDFVVIQKETGAKVIIECDGFSYHDRNSKQFEYERRRERELQRLGYRIYRFSATELFRDPWEAGLELVDAITAWPEFRNLDLPENLRELAIELINGAPESAEAIGEDTELEECEIEVGVTSDSSDALNRNGSLEDLVEPELEALLTPEKMGAYIAEIRTILPYPTYTFVARVLQGTQLTRVRRISEQLSCFGILSKSRFPKLLRKQLKFLIVPFLTHPPSSKLLTEMEPISRNDDRMRMFDRLMELGISVTPKSGACVLLGVFVEGWPASVREYELFGSLASTDMKPAPDLLADMLNPDFESWASVRIVPAVPDRIEGETLLEETRKGFVNCPLMRPDTVLKEEQRTVRKSYRRAWEPWTKAENEILLRCLRTTKDPERLAMVFLRASASLKKHLRTLPDEERETHDQNEALAGS